MRRRDQEKSERHEAAERGDGHDEAPQHGRARGLRLAWLEAQQRQHQPVDDRHAEKADPGERQRQFAEFLRAQQAGIGGDQYKGCRARQNSRQEIDAAVPKQSHPPINQPACRKSTGARATQNAGDWRPPASVASSLLRLGQRQKKPRSLVVRRSL